MRDDSLKATVQYQDFIGTVAADHRDDVYLQELAEKYGVDTKRYFVFGIDVYIDELGSRDEISRANINILAVDIQVLRVGDVDSIKQYIDDHQGVLPYVKLKIESYLGEVIDYFKRVDIVLSYRNITANEYRLTNG